jgi:hypothetical protein
MLLMRWGVVGFDADEQLLIIRLATESDASPCLADASAGARLCHHRPPAQQLRGRECRGSVPCPLVFFGRLFLLMGCSLISSPLDKPNSLLCCIELSW